MPRPAPATLLCALRRTFFPPALVAAAIVSCAPDSHDWSTSILARHGTVWHYDVVFAANGGWQATFRANVEVLHPALAFSRDPRLDAIWKISYLNGIYATAPRTDSAFVYAPEDTIITVPFHSSDVMNVGNTYVFPLSVGRQWAGAYCCPDSFSVAALDTVRVAAGRFAAYRITHTMSGPGYTVTSTTWLDPDVGIVKLTERKSQMDNTTEITWKLIGYELLWDDPAPVIIGPGGTIPDPFKRR